MARRSLKPQLNQIRTWVRQGRTDAWIAHQLEVTVAELREFRDQHDLSADEQDSGAQEVDLRDEIEAEIEAATAEEAAREAEKAEEEAAEEEAEGTEAEEEPGSQAGGEELDDSGSAAGEEEKQAEGAARPRRRRRRGRRGRGRRRELEATFDHGERDGYGLWLDAAVKDNPVYAEHWAGKREVTVRIEADQIVIRRAGEPEPEDSDD